MRNCRNEWERLSPEQKTRTYDKKKNNRLKLKLQAFAVLGSTCKCGFSDIRALQVDHIHGGGTKERKVNNNKSDAVLTYYKFIIREPELAKKKFQLLCANCNWIKRHEANELSTH